MISEKELIHNALKCVKEVCWNEGCDEKYYIGQLESGKMIGYFENKYCYRFDYINQGSVKIEKAVDIITAETTEYRKYFAGQLAKFQKLLKGAD